MPRVDNGEVHLHYQLEGQPGAPVLILANSLGTTLDVWAPQMPILLEHFRVLRFDARGHGQSGVPAGPYSIADMGTDVISLMDQLGIAQAHFCGLSMGGMIGIWLASHHRARIDRLVLCHTAATLPPPEIWNQRIALVEHGGMAAVAEEVVERWFTRDFQAHAVRQIGVVRDILLQTSPVGYAASCAAVRDADLNDVLSDVQAPTLVIGGKHDQAVAPAQVRQLAGHLAHARYLELNAAHLSNWEVAQSFTSQVRDFLLGG
ncbi:MAG: 3-oxoadipate enol-lactonase [Pseudomonadota bacterium]|nr:3-oxoadipate enol-lactonase [Pseudomonadota bacterium]